MNWKGGDGARADDVHWEGTVGAIRSRLQLPGTDPALAASIAASLELLRQQCLQLPAAMPQPATGAGASAATPKPPAPAVPAEGVSTSNGSGGAGAAKAEATSKGGSASNGGGITGAPPVVLAPHGAAAAPRAPAPPTPPVPPAPPAAPFIPPPTAKGLDAEAAAGVTVNEANDGAPTDDAADAKDDVEMEADNLLRRMPAWRRKRFLASVSGELADDGEEEGRRDRERSPRRMEREEQSEEL